MKADNRVVCGYCKKPAELVDGSAIYPHRKDLYDKLFYRCVPCGAHVGCHPGTSAPLGRLANSDLRQAKSAAHSAFDPIWRDSKETTRSEAYEWLAEQLGIESRDCHIGEFDLDTCNRVVSICFARRAA